MSLLGRAIVTNREPHCFVSSLFLVLCFDSNPDTWPHLIEESTVVKNQERLRVVSLASGHPVNDPRVTHKQARSLARAGYDVTVLGCGGDDSEEIEGVRLVKVTSERVKGLWDRAKVLPTIYRMAASMRPHIVVCHEPESAVVGVFVRARTGAKLHFDVHELFHETLSSRMPGWARSCVRLLSMLLLKYLGRTADLVTVASPANAEFYFRTRKERDVYVIHNSPRPETFPCAEQRSNGPVTLCHEGVLDLNRGFVQAIEALAIARSKAALRLVFLGRIHPSCATLFEDTIEKLGLADAVEGPNWIDYCLLGKELSRCQVGLVTMQPTPNNYLSLSNKLYNYMACGMPVIVPRGSASADLVEKYECGLCVDTTKPSEIAKAMVLLGTDEQLRSEMSANGRAAIQNELGWHRMEELLLHLYSGLVPQHRHTIWPRSADRAA